jgi:hypothetical protein
VILCSVDSHIWRFDYVDPSLAKKVVENSAINISNSSDNNINESIENANDNSEQTEMIVDC